MTAHPGVHAAAARALEMVTSGARVGLGTGRAAAAFIAQLGAAVRRGLAVTCVPTSEASAAQARALGISLFELDEDVELDLTVDGADEVAPNLDLIKGRGGAMVRERIVAAASRRQVILIGSEKLVTALGERGGIPIEVIPMACGVVSRRLKELGLRPTVRQVSTGAGPAVTDNGNLTLDAELGAPLPDAGAARALEAALCAIPGVVDSGLFLGTAERALVGYPDGRVEVVTSTGG
jgi:ribose 5-phosphate isomerase A